MRFHCLSTRGALVLLVLILCPLLAGCVGMMANLMHVGWGNFVPPKYDGFAQQRVAVICVSQSSLFGPTAAAEEIAERVHDYLGARVAEIQMVQRQEIDRWIDENDWNDIDYRELGRGVGAQKLVAIELKSFSLYEGKTLFKGRADIELTVYDLTVPNGAVVYENQPPQIQYPLTAGQYTADSSEADFRRRFLDVIANQIARDFYKYDVAEDFGRDSTALGF